MNVIKAMGCAVVSAFLFFSQAGADEAGPPNPGAGSLEVAAEYRIWTDSEGDTAEAKLVRLEDNKAYVQDKQGKVWPVPLDSLSAADYSYIQAVNPSKGHASAVVGNMAHGGDAGFGKLAEPFLENYCLDCHDDATQKGGVSLHELGDVTAKDADMWKRVWEQVSLKEMPPRKKKNQPELMERKELSDWITTRMTEAMKDKGGFRENMRPNKGNHLDHDLLFGTKYENLEPASTPARLWRIHPQEHLVRLNDLVTIKRKYDPKRPGVWTHGDAIPPDLDGVLQVQAGADGPGKRNPPYVFSFPLILAGSKDHGIRNYPFLYSVNSSEMMTIGKVAEEILRFMAYGSNLPLTGDQKIGEESKSVLRPMTPVYDLLNGPEVNDEGIRKAIEFLFEALTLRSPTSAETSAYMEIVGKLIGELGKEEGAILGLTALFLDRDALFRPELCKSGTPDAYGRVALSGDELALAINAAFSYIRPDSDHLWTALAEGKLKTREDVKREVTRILNDDSIRKPRVLQFFREYFDYDRASSICKDKDEIGKSGGHAHSYYAVVNSMIANTDRLVELILWEDKNVLKELLTTNRVIYQPYTSTDARSGTIYKSDIEYFGEEGVTKRHMKAPEGFKLPEAILHGEPKMMGNFEYEFLGMTYAIFPNPTEPIHVRQPIYGGWNRRPAVDGLKALTTVSTDKRLGILTHPSWLISHSDAMDNHAIMRGHWIRQRLLGDDVPSVPITVNAMLPFEPESTLRHRMRVTREDECWRCHQKMDPLGLPFEMYNHVGMIRSMEKGKPVDASGEILFSGNPALDGPVEDALEMIRKLAESERVEQVFVRHVFRFWMGRNETINDAPILQEAHLVYKKSGGSMKALLTSLLTSDAFLYRKVDRK
ncbi:MAG: DUF1588 domain-containing protein [Verrucomicrobia bacterium]|nr:DUF1588 domain-containing protein [Verrucomicrobiota bacterium]